MLNRTLNGINLGTRTLASTQAGLNIVDATLRLRHDHPQKRKDTMRDAMAKLMGDPSISDSISRRSPSSPIASSPFGPSFRPDRGRWMCPARFEVVVAVSVEVAEPVATTAGALRAAWPQIQAWPQARACAPRGAAMTRAESIPVATFATGG